MKTTNQDHHDILPWKYYFVTLMEVTIAFSLGTFALMLFMSELDDQMMTIIMAVLMVASYLTVIALCITRMIQRLSPGALMLMVPIAPLGALLLVVALLPVVQLLQ